VRFAMLVLLWLLTTAVLAVAVPMTWAQKNIVDVDGYVALAQKAARDPALQTAVASELATRATALITERGYTVDSSEVHNAAATYTAGPDFPRQFADVNRLLHGWIFTGVDAQSGDTPWVVDLAEMLNDSAFQPMLANFNVRVPAKVPVPVTVSAPKMLQSSKLRLLATWGPVASIVVAALAGVCALLTLAAARGRGRALAGLGVSALLVGATGWAAIEVVRSHIADALNTTTGDIRSVADVMVGVAESSLHQWLNLTLAAGGVLAVFGVLVAALGSLLKR
jgi:hypothetical protein